MTSKKQSKASKNKAYFNISSVHRDDLKQVGIDGSKVDDDQMEELARKLEDDYCEQLFWPSLRVIADEIMCLPRLPEREISDEESEDLW